MKLSDRIRSHRRRSVQAEVEEHLTQIYADRIALAASKQLLQHALMAMEQDPKSLPALTVQQRIRTFLERHP